MSEALVTPHELPVLLKVERFRIFPGLNQKPPLRTSTHWLTKNSQAGAADSHIRRQFFEAWALLKQGFGLVRLRRVEND